jgi:predicted RNase H-like nuclease (RuvC/YqgF family)
MTMTDDLVKRLVDWDEYDEGKINDMRLEAKASIEALTAERDRAYASGYSDAETEISKSDLGQRNAFLHSQYANAADRIEQLERELSISRMAQVVMDNTVEALAKADARIEALTTALWDILACETPNANATVTRMVAIAKAALKGETP